MSKHTPGPWTVHGFNTADECCGIMAGSVTADGKHINSDQVLPFFDCDPQGMHYQRHMADKYLIESAPDLLIMLRELLATAEEVDSGNKREPNFTGYSFAPEIFSKCRAAIAKATGV